MKKKINRQNKGFTLAELLIVVAIIGVLVAVSIPIFTSQVKKSKLATNQANARAGLAAATAYVMDNYQTFADSDSRAIMYISSLGQTEISQVEGTKVPTTDIGSWSLDMEGNVDLGKVHDIWIFEFSTAPEAVFDVYIPDAENFDPDEQDDYVTAIYYVEGDGGLD